MKEFVHALGKKSTYDPVHNGFVLFGMAWGLPIPIVCVLMDMFMSGRPFTMAEFWNTFAVRPIHLVFALHPFLFGVLFGAMGTVRHRKDARIRELLAELERHVVELDRANAQLKELDQMKRDFVANVTHELKTPLISIQGYNEAIAEGRFGPINQKQKDGLLTAMRNIDRLIALINELLEMSRIDSDKLVLNRMAFNLETTLVLILRNFEPQLKAKHIEFERPSAEEPYYVWADPDKIARVLTNLLSNAIKFTPSDGKVGVTFRRMPDRVLAVSVWDTGRGVPEHLRSHLFERFWQADGSARKEFQGTGLGLAIVKGILDAHKAPVTIESREGEGTCVTFELPLTDRPAPPASAPVESSCPNKEVKL